MDQQERLRKTVRHLRRQPSSSISEIARSLELNRETVRRDIARLEADGIAARRAGRVWLNEGRDAHMILAQYGILTRDERLQDVARMVHAKQRVRITSLAKVFHVTAATIRSDLEQLEKTGAVDLHHGYVTSRNKSPGDIDNGLQGHDRSVGLIVARAVQHIESGDTVFLDNSVFALGVAQTIEHARDITVITNSLQVALHLSQREYPCEIITLSGRIVQNGPSVLPLAQQPALDQHRIEKSILGIGAAGEHSLYAPLEPSAEELIQKLCQKSAQLFLCVCSVDVGPPWNASDNASLRRVLPHVTEIIVDDGVDHEQVRQAFPEDIPVALCGQDYVYNLRRNPGKRIGFTVFPGHTEFRQEVSEGIEMACNRRNALTLHTRLNGGDYESIVDGVQPLIDEGIDLLIDYSSNHDVAVLLAQKAAELAIPLIMVDIAVPNAVYFGANNILAGQMAGERAAREIDLRWQGKLDSIVVLERGTAGSACKQRVLGSIDALRRHVTFNARNVKHIDCSRGIDYYAHKLERYLSRLKADETCLVVSFAEDTTVETHDLILRYAKKRKIMMVAQNYSHHVAHLMRQIDSPLIGCVSYAQEEYGERILELAERLLQGTKVDPVNYTHHEWIGPPNRGTTDAGQPEASSRGR